MENSIHPRLRRSQTFSALSVDSWKHHEAPYSPGSSSLRVISRAQSWAVLPMLDLSSPSGISYLESRSNLRREAVDLEALPQQPRSTCNLESASSSLPTAAAINDFPFLPFIRGITHSPITYEALAALLLSINVRELIGNGADAVVKALVKKAVALTAALLIATLIDVVPSLLEKLGMDLGVDVLVLRGMAGTISGWVGAQASDPLGWKVEKRIADWLWPKEPPPVVVVSASASLPAALAMGGSSLPAINASQQSQEKAHTLPRRTRGMRTSLLDAIPVLI